MNKLKYTIISLLIFAALSACGSRNESPEDVLKAYHKALKSLDFDAIKACCTSGSDTMVDVAQSHLSSNDIERLKNDFENTKVEIIGSKINGDNATVAVRTTNSRGVVSEDSTYLKKEDGKWKVVASK